MIAKGLKVGFSKVKYENIAPFVNLDPYGDAQDAKSFLINRARMPTRDFKNISEELERLGSQYRRPDDHANEEARSRYIAGVGISFTLPLFELANPRNSFSISL